MSYFHETAAQILQEQLAEHIEIELQKELQTDDEQADAFFAGMIIQRHISNEFFDSRITFVQTLEFFFDDGPRSVEDDFFENERDQKCSE